jgi:CTP:molybdopterin cytidylyltransferase MocA
MSNVAAILLAAGRSTRMGAFKPLLPFGGKTVVECCVDNVRAAGIEDIVVVIGHRAEEVCRQLEHCQVRFALNSDHGSEMGVSIARGIEQLDDRAKAVLIALVDHPAVLPETMNLLINEWQRTGARLAQPEHHGRGGHPVLIDLVYREELLHLDPQLGLRGLFDRNRDEVRRVPVDSPFVARDIDTWEDYCRLHEDVFGVPPPEIG